MQNYDRTKGASKLFTARGTEDRGHPKVVKTRFLGLTVQPVSKITAYPPCRIDRVIVAAHKTLYGDVKYECLGGRLGSEELVPLCHDTDNFAEAWRVKEQYEARLRQAQREQEARDAAWQKERASG